MLGETEILMNTTTDKLISATDKSKSNGVGLALGIFAIASSAGVAVYAAFPAPEQCSSDVAEQHSQALKALGVTAANIYATTQDGNGEKCSLVLNLG